MSGSAQPSLTPRQQSIVDTVNAMGITCASYKVIVVHGAESDMSAAAKKLESQGWTRVSNEPTCEKLTTAIAYKRNVVVDGVSACNLALLPVLAVMDLDTWLVIMDRDGVLPRMNATYVDATHESGLVAAQPAC